MIVIGVDTHKRSHTAAAVDGATARAIAEQTVRANRRSFDDLLTWARGLEAGRVWAIEDCRHVSGALERFLLARGERTVRVAPKLMAGGRSARRPRARQVRRDRCGPDRETVRSSVCEAVATCGGQPGNRCPKWILRAARGAVQVRLRRHLASALMMAR